MNDTDIDTAIRRLGSVDARTIPNSLPLSGGPAHTLPKVERRRCVTDNYKAVDDVYLPQRFHPVSATWWSLHRVNNVRRFRADDEHTTTWLHGLLLKLYTGDGAVLSVVREAFPDDVAAGAQARARNLNPSLWDRIHNLASRPKKPAVLP